jgi:hypothetical protein
MYLSTTQIFNFWRPSIFEAPKISQHNQKFATQKRGSRALKNERMNKRTNEQMNGRTKERTNERTNEQTNEANILILVSRGCLVIVAAVFTLQTNRSGERTKPKYLFSSVVAVLSSLPLPPPSSPSSDPVNFCQAIHRATQAKLRRAIQVNFRRAIHHRATQAKLRRALQRTPQSTTRRLLRGELKCRCWQKRRESWYKHDEQ